MKSRILRYFLIVGMLLGFNLSFSASLESANLRSINPHENDKPHCKGKKCKMSTVKTSMTSPDIQPVRDASKDYEKKANELEEETSLDNFDSSVTQESFLDESGESFFHQIPMLSNLADEMKNNTGDDIREAFISREETDENYPAKLKEISRLDQYCNHQAKSSTWLQCDKNKETGEYNIKGGEFGVALFALIYNDGKHGIEVYRNSRIRKGKEYWDIQWNSKNLVPPSEDPIPIVIKITTEKAEMKHRARWGDEQTLLEKEIRRTKEASKFTFHTGLKILPDIYDIRIGGTEQVHPIHKEAYIQYQVQGKTVMSVIKDSIDDERNSMVYHMRLIFSKFDQWLRGARRNQQGNAVVEMTEDQVLFREAGDKARKEMWLRGRLRLTIISYVLYYATWMWEEMLYCDSHGNNIMIVRHIIKSVGDLKRAKKDSSTIISSHNVRYSETTKTSTKEKQELQTGINAYSFLPENIKWIDASRALPILPILKEIRDIKPEESDPAKFLIGGCELYRELSRADFVELQRVGIHTAFGGSEKARRNNHRSFYSDAVTALPLTRSIKRVYTTYKKFSPPSLQGTLDTSTFMLSPEADYIEIWKELFSAMDKYEKEVAKIDAIFSTILEQIEKLPETKACVKSFATARQKYEETIPIMRGPMPWYKAPKLLGRGCSLADMREGAKKVQQLIIEAASKFPDFATVKTYGERQTHKRLYSL